MQDKMDLIIHAATNNPSTNRNEVFNFFQIANPCIYDNVTNVGREAKKRKDNMHDIARKCVNEQAHDNILTRIDTNQFKFKNADENKHPIHIWNRMYWSKRLQKFHESEIY